MPYFLIIFFFKFRKSNQTVDSTRPTSKLIDSHLNLKLKQVKYYTYLLIKVLNK